MKKLLIIAAIVVALLIVGLLVMNNNSKSSTTPSTTTTPPPATSPTPAPTSSNPTPPASTSEATKVTIQDNSFTPASVTVKKGTTVTWTNQGNTTHTVTESDGKTGPDSQYLDSGKTYSFTYDTVGTFKYHCTIHSGMTGTVVVTE